LHSGPTVFFMNTSQLSSKSSTTSQVNDNDTLSSAIEIFSLNPSNLGNC
jgi:hypothetical protein